MATCAAVDPRTAMAPTVQRSDSPHRQDSHPRVQMPNVWSSLRPLPVRHCGGIGNPDPAQLVVMLPDVAAYGRRRVREGSQIIRFPGMGGSDSRCARKRAGSVRRVVGHTCRRTRSRWGPSAMIESLELSAFDAASRWTPSKVLRRPMPPAIRTWCFNR
ncbi:hypothetical protein ACLOJK_015786 [Asimina triloba]